jgi:DNA processing protein
MSAGCNRLIKSNKAGMIESAADLQYFLGWDKDAKENIPRQRSLFTELNEEEKAILKTFENEEKLSVDIISLRTNQPVGKVSALMLNMEFKGVVKVLPGNYYKLV